MDLRDSIFWNTILYLNDNLVYKIHLHSICFKRWYFLLIRRFFICLNFRNLVIFSFCICVEKLFHEKNASLREDFLTAAIILDIMAESDLLSSLYLRQFRNTIKTEDLLAIFKCCFSSVYMWSLRTSASAISWELAFNFFKP